MEQQYMNNLPEYLGTAQLFQLLQLFQLFHSRLRASKPTEPGFGRIFRHELPFALDSSTFHFSTHNSAVISRWGDSCSPLHSSLA